MSPYFAEEIIEIWIIISTVEASCVINKSYVLLDRVIKYGLQFSIDRSVSSGPCGNARTIMPV